MSSVLDDQVSTLGASGDQVRDLARAIYEHGKAAGDFLQSLSDALASYLLFQAAAAAAGASGNLPVQLQCAALAALQVVMATEAIEGVTSAISGAWAFFQMVEGTFRAQFARFESVALPDLPQISYDTPEV